MTPLMFDHLLALEGPSIEKLHTAMQKPLSAAERLAITLRYICYCIKQLVYSFTHEPKIVLSFCGSVWSTGWVPFHYQNTVARTTSFVCFEMSESSF